MLNQLHLKYYCIHNNYKIVTIVEPGLTADRQAGRKEGKQAVSQMQLLLSKKI